jgi:hypothetical protein
MSSTEDEAYCVKCKEVWYIEDRRVEETNGRRFAKGTCPECGTKVTRILGKLTSVVHTMKETQVAPVLSNESRPYSDWEGLPDGWTPQQGLEAIGGVLLLGGDSTQRQIAEVGIALTTLLLLKNQRYGDSALNPIEVFTTGLTTRQRMAVRMDDKVNRLKNGMADDGGDGEYPGLDLMGYLALDVIARWKEARG